MGLNPLWQEDFFNTIQQICLNAQMVTNQPHCIINCNHNLFVHLIPLNTVNTAEEFISLQTSYQQRSCLLVHLWEDVWLAKRKQVLSRLKSFMGLNKRFHGRKGLINLIDRQQASNFLNNYHLQGFVHAKYHYGLFFNNDLLAVASFSKTRPMKHIAAGYISAELVRFATIDGITIVGGLSKFLKQFIKTHKVNDIMTYADRDWSIGLGYEKLGFTLSEVTKPLAFIFYEDLLLRKVDEQTSMAKVILDKAFITNENYFRVFNTGNLKFHLYV